MSVVITSEEKAMYERQRELEREERERQWRMEIYKMLASLFINIFVILVLILGAFYGPTDLSSRFMSLVEIVIGAIFGVTATQVAKE